MYRMRCLIVGAGEFESFDFQVRQDDFIIAADGGYEYLKSLKIEPDLVVGDFDSISCIPEHPHVIRLSREKDDTDMKVCMEEGLKRGCGQFYIYGGMGGRLEHTYANMQALAWLSKKGIKGFLCGQGRVVTAVTDGTLHFSKEHRGYISVFAHSNLAKGVTLKGLKFPLHNATVSNHVPLGISNEFTGVDSLITVKEGTLLVIYETE